VLADRQAQPPPAAELPAPEPFELPLPDRTTLRSAPKPAEHGNAGGPRAALRRYYALAGAACFGVLDLVEIGVLLIASGSPIHVRVGLVAYRVVAALAGGAIAGLIFRPFEVLVPLPTRPLRGAAFFGVVSAVIYAVVSVTMEPYAQPG